MDRNAAPVYLLTAETNIMLIKQHISPRSLRVQPSVFCSTPSILISHLSTAPVSAAPVLSGKGHSGPPSRVHSFSREINGSSQQSQPHCFFVICWHRVVGCLQKVNVHLTTYGDQQQMDPRGPWWSGGCLFCYKSRTVKGAGRADGAFPDSVSARARFIILHFFGLWRLRQHQAREVTESDSISPRLAGASAGGPCSRRDGLPLAF